MRCLMMLFSLGVGLLTALGAEAGSPPTEAAKAKIVADAVAALASAPQNACPEGFAYIPAGPFVMGSDARRKNELPARIVTTNAYCMAVHETTTVEYQKVMMKAPLAMSEDYTRKTFPRKNFNSPEQPVILVCWMEADTYCKKVGGRLPTEAEWEKAAQGPRGLEYGTHSGALSKEEANYAEVKPTDVCSYPKNDYGLCDMAGNVWEWVNDWYAADAYQQMNAENPQGPKKGKFKVVRGGSWDNGSADVLRVGFRDSYFVPDLSVSSVGFRCVVASQDSKK